MRRPVNEGCHRAGTLVGLLVPKKPNFMGLFLLCGRVAQLGEHQAGSLRVVGSIPIPSTIFFLFPAFYFFAYCA